MSDIVMGRKNVIIANTGAFALTENQSGSVILLAIPIGAGYTVTLPTPTVDNRGINYKLVATAAFGFAVVVNFAGGANAVGAFSVGNAAAPSVAVTAGGPNFTGTASVGTWMEVVCDGARYIYSGATSAVAGLA